MSTEISPFAPSMQPAMFDVAGVGQACMSAGIKHNTDAAPGAKPDVLLVSFTPGTSVAGVFTTSKTCAAPVDWCRKALVTGSARALVVNSGNANAFSGVAGMELVNETVDRAASVIGCDRGDVFVASTGVIGEVIETARIVGAIDTLAPQVAAGGWDRAAHAIATTDTFIKLASRQLEIGGQTINLSGYSKGAGMIMPNMATMLCFVYTDANIPANRLQASLNRAIDRSFHCITVDSDTSTNDTVLAFATGQAGGDALDGDAMELFDAALDDILLDLAVQVVKDGEGISKLVRVHVDGAANDADAHTFAMSVANSPLVKTAMAGADANWGRVVMAVGKAGPDLDKALLGVRFGDHVLAANGNPVGGDTAAVDAYMGSSEIDVFVTVGRGQGQCTVYTSDLTHGYISINADYRT